MDSSRHRPVWRAFLEAGVVAGLALISVVPYFYYLTHVAFADTIRHRLATTSMEQLLQADLVLVGIVLVICSTVGSLLARRYKLAGLGTIDDLKRALPYLAAGGVVLSAGTYLLFGRSLARRVPGYYPTTLGWAVLITIKGAIFDETVARFGMMTIFSGVVRRPAIANALQAIFFTFLTLKAVSFYGFAFDWSFFFISSLVSSLVVHLALGFTYARVGLISAAAMHLLIDLKYVAHALLN